MDKYYWQRWFFCSDAPRKFVERLWVVILGLLPQIGARGLPRRVPQRTKERRDEGVASTGIGVQFRRIVTAVCSGVVQGGAVVAHTFSR